MTEKKNGNHPLGTWEVMGDFAGEGFVDIVAGRDGHVVALPRSADRLPGEVLSIVRSLQEVGSRLRHLEAHADELARACRAEGVSWSLIGFCLGLTGEAARQRYSGEIP